MNIADHALDPAALRGREQRPQDHRACLIGIVGGKASARAMVSAWLSSGEPRRIASTERTISNGASCRGSEVNGRARSTNASAASILPASIEVPAACERRAARRAGSSLRSAARSNAAAAVTWAPRATALLAGGLQLGGESLVGAVG